MQNMVIHRGQRAKPKSRSILILTLSIAAIAFLFLFSSFFSTNLFSLSSNKSIRDLIVIHSRNRPRKGHDKFLYWGSRIDCPGKHCDSCAGLGHQESSLRCSLEEALYLQRTFVMPSRMCINPIHNKKGILHHYANSGSEEGWAASSCFMDSLYDLELISDKVPVILDNSKMWHQVLATSMKLGSRGVAHVRDVSRTELKENSLYSNMLLINRTANPLSWY
ncbi:unnamed protein product [Cuscuta europaea]|uniref:Uncharacterized protein n=1 Tax=Cuscuta europaea TaxID=41803 RepID=A0A9P0ZL32_CUSEU|nr:unnamed protein product [Cuscuta europaea]